MTDTHIPSIPSLLAPIWSLCATIESLDNALPAPGPTPGAEHPIHRRRRTLRARLRDDLVAELADADDQIFHSTCRSTLTPLRRLATHLIRIGDADLTRALRVPPALKASFRVRMTKSELADLLAGASGDMLAAAGDLGLELDWDDDFPGSLLHACAARSAATAHALRFHILPNRWIGGCLATMEPLPASAPESDADPVTWLRDQVAAFPDAATNAIRIHLTSGQSNGALTLLSAGAAPPALTEGLADEYPILALAGTGSAHARLRLRRTLPELADLMRLDGRARRHLAARLI